MLFGRDFMRKNYTCDVIINNMAETFNAYTIHVRTKHLIDILEDVGIALVERIVVKKIKKKS